MSLLPATSSSDGGVSGEQPHAAVILPGEDAEAIVLDLVNPAGALPAALSLIG